MQHDSPATQTFQIRARLFAQDAPETGAVAESEPVQLTIDAGQRAAGDLWHFSRYPLPVTRRGRALTDNEFRAQELEQRLRRLPVDQAQEHLDALLPLAGKIVVNGGQGRLEKWRLRKVVVTDQGNVLGYLDSLGVQGPESAQRHVVVCYHDRRESSRRSFQELRYRCIPAPGAPVAFDATTRFQAGIFQGLEPTFATFFGGRPAGWSGDAGDLPVAQVEQMSGGKPRTVLLIDDDGGHI